MERKVVVVAPTFNEEANIGSFVARVLAQQEKIPNYQLAILISDSHSSDKTGEITEELARKYKNVYYFDSKIPGPGRLGTGISKGLDYAIAKLGADILITMEADLSNDPDQIPQFVKKLESADIVLGSRYCSGGKIVNWSWWRKGFSLGANYTLRLLAWTAKSREFTNLYRAFTKEVWFDLRPKIVMHTGWLFVPAFAFEATNSKFKTTELPIIYFDRLGGRSKMQTLSYTKNLLHYALRYRLKKYL